MKLPKALLYYCSEIDTKKPFAARQGKGMETLAKRRAILGCSPYSPHWMSLKGYPILFTTRLPVKSEKRLTIILIFDC
jgi:hypothetical protein